MRRASTKESIKERREKTSGITSWKRRVIIEASYVYILASQRNGTLYIGSTTNLVKRVWQHKNNLISGFTAKYNIHQLVYYEVHGSIIEAARREKRMKAWLRRWKLNFIEKHNPTWRDLYEDIGGGI